MIYACSRCCSKVEKKGMVCPRCHRGVGVQVDPVPVRGEQECTDMCKGVSRLRKRPPNFYRDTVDENMR